MKWFLTKRRLKIQNKHQRREEHISNWFLISGVFFFFLLFSESSRDYYILFDVSVLCFVVRQKSCVNVKKICFRIDWGKLINVRLPLSFTSDCAGAFREADKGGLRLKHIAWWKPYRVRLHLHGMLQWTLSETSRQTLQWKGRFFFCYLFSSKTSSATSF